VDDIDKYMNSVKKYGGKMITPKLEVPGYGWLATCLDTEGNVFGLWQSD
jgi:predicted enzyme related to lactoylglutathione lyase